MELVLTEQEQQEVDAIRAELDPLTHPATAKAFSFLRDDLRDELVTVIRNHVEASINAGLATRLLISSVPPENLTSGFIGSLHDSLFYCLGNTGAGSRVDEVIEAFIKSADDTIAEDISNMLEAPALRLSGIKEHYKSASKREFDDLARKSGLDMSDPQEAAVS